MDDEKPANSDAMAFLEGLLGGPLTFSGMMQAMREGEEWSLEEMAAKLGVSARYVTLVEEGVRVPSEEVARDWARRLGYSEEQFARLAEEARAEKIREADAEADLDLTREQLLQIAEDGSQEMLGISYDEALRRIDAGEFDGSIAQAWLSSIRSMLAVDKEGEEP